MKKNVLFVFFSSWCKKPKFFLRIRVFYIVFVNNKKDVHYNILPNEAPNRFQRKASFGRACKAALEASKYSTWYN